MSKEYSNTELRPCPRCGKDQYVYGITKSSGGGFQIECHHCGFVVPTEGDLIEVINAWNNYPRLPKWTTELPTEEGWYWWCGDLRCIPTIGRIGYQGSKADGLFTMPPLRSFVESFPITAVGGFWAGPIPEPKVDAEMTAEILAKANAEMPAKATEPKIEKTCRTCMETKLADGPFCTQFGGTMEVSETYACSRWYSRNVECRDDR